MTNIISLQMASSENAASDGLIFIPDISGYTSFVNSTAIQHSKHIMEELLEVVIDANILDLELSEIEGDALLFFKEGPAPNIEELLNQVRKMYMDFHQYLKKFDTQRICSCGACSTAHNLNLKFISHYGEIAEKDIKGRKVLFGSDVILAHRLLKNHIDSNEYALLSDQLVDSCDPDSRFSELSWSRIYREKEIYDLGEVNYCFIELGNLMQDVPEPETVDYSLPGANHLQYEFSKVIEAPLDLVFNVISDYNIRSKFNPAQSGTDQINHEVFQNGSSHRCLISNDANDPFFIAHDFKLEQDRVNFVETDHNKKVSVVWTLKRISENTTEMKISNFTPPNLIRQWLFKLFVRRKLDKYTREGWAIFNEYCRDLYQSKKAHENSIILPQAFE
jgi:hypothetical protein